MRTIIAIGRNVLLSHKGAQTEVTAPHLLLIGKNVNLTGHIAISTHDYSWSVVRGVTGEILVKQKPIFIGDNAFIGWGASIFGRYRNRGGAIIEVHAVAGGYVEDDMVGGVYLRIASVRQIGAA